MMYPKLAWTGIRKNQRTYLPYFLTCVLMTMMQYIIAALCHDPVISTFRGGEIIQGLLSFGTGIMCLFSFLFLFYSNSFLIRRRFQEFGLYHVLGMGKGNIARILLWETLILAGSSVILGLGLGILLSKLCQLAVTAMLQGEVSYTFSVQPMAFLMTLVIFAAIHGLIFLNALRKVSLSSTTELLGSASAGEKKPKANYLLALAGLILLGAAYYIARKVEDPLTAMNGFLIAVVMVILATYLLFISGSVVICRLLQYCKGYYYKAKHFISVSTMLYRMKRNGAGLASICILSTMVLVTVSTTVCLYLGGEDSVKERYPRDLILEAGSRDPAPVMDQAVEDTLKAYDLTQEDRIAYRYLPLYGWMDQNGNYNLQEVELGGSFLTLELVALEDYNQLAGTDYTLAPGEALVSSDSPFPQETVTLSSGPSFRVLRQVSFEGVDEGTWVSSNYLYFIVPMESLQACQKACSEALGQEIDCKYFYGFNVSCSNAMQLKLLDEIMERYRKDLRVENGFSLSYRSMAEKLADTMALNGGLLFLGLFLGLAFLIGTVLIMYYKQITEGYEDQHTFSILQKVGMTRQEIRASVNSQVLTVFFLPLAAAGIHVCFAFKMMSLLLQLVGLTNVRLFGWVTLGCFLLFAVFYAGVYFATANAYFRIVSRENQAKSV